MKSIHTCFAILAIFCSTHCFAQLNNPYIFNKSPLRADVFVQLPLGSIKAKGWLLKQLELQRDGATGHAEELYDGDNHLGANSDWLGGKGNGWEKVPYYVKGLVALAYTLDDPKLKAKAQKFIDWTLDHQLENGSFGPAKMNDWWPRMPMMYALQSYYEATNDKRVIPFLTKYFNYQLANLDKEPLKDWGKSRAGDNMELVLWLYNRTGQKKLLDLAEKLKQQAYPWTDIFNKNQFYYFGDDFQPKHMVNVGEALKFPIVYSQLNRDTIYRNAMQRGINHIMKDHGLPIGLGSGTEFLAGKSSIEGVETCTVVEWMQSLETAARIVHDASIGDRLEKIAFNSLPAQFDREVKNHSYYTLPNQVISVRGGQGFNQDYDTGIISSPYSGFECCRYNMHMGWPYFVKNSWLATPEQGLAVVSYAPMELNAYVNGITPIKISSITNYPFDDRIQLNIALKSAAKFPLVLRIPTWCKQPTVLVNGVAVKNVKSGKMLRLIRTWKNKDKVELRFPMEIVTTPQVNNGLSVERGPIVYALEIGEEKKVFKKLPVQGFSEYELLPTTAWNYGLSSKSVQNIQVIKSEMPVNPFDYKVTPIKLKLPVKQVTNWILTPSKTSAMDIPYYPVVAHTAEQEITLVPYGSEDLRLSIFPHVERKVEQTKDIQEDFAGGMPRDWIFYGGGWFTKDKAIIAASNAGSGGYGIRGSKIVANATNFENFTYTATVKLTTKGDAGLIFRVADPAIGADNYKGYYVGLNPDEKLMEFGKANNNWAPIKTTDYAFQINHSYVVTVRAVGGDFEFYIDNNLVMKANDNTFSTGSIGLRTYQAQAVYQDVSVKAM